MMNVPYEKMVCDSDYGDGGVYFYNDYFEWVSRNSRRSFQIFYKDIKDVKIVRGRKKKVIVDVSLGSPKNLYLYKADTLKMLIYQAIQRISEEGKKETNEPKEDENQSEDYIAKLEKLAKLHESGALDDEEFALAKKKILG